MLVLWSAFASILIVSAIALGINSVGVYILRDLPVYLVLVVVFVQNIRIGVMPKHLLLLVLVVALAFANYLFLNPAYVAPLNNIRQIVMPVVILFMYRMLFKKSSASDIEIKLPAFAYKLIIFIFLFGLIELITGLWKIVGLHQYFLLKGIPVDESGLSYMFYEPILGYRQRMTSTMLDPISLGHLFATTGALAFYGFCWRGRRRYIVGLISLMGLLLCFSKGAFLHLFLAVVILNPRIFMLIRMPMVLLPVVVVALLPNIDGIMIHLTGLINSVSTITLFGYGIGSAGNYAKMFSADTSVYEVLGISDTFVGSVFGQIGFVGFLLWGYAIYKIIGSKRHTYALRFLLAQVIVSFMSENTLNVTSFILPAFFYMLLAHSDIYRRELELGTNKMLGLK